MVLVTTTASNPASLILDTAGPEKMPCVRMAYTLEAPASSSLGGGSKYYHIKRFRLRKSLPQLLPASIVIRSERMEYTLEAPASSSLGGGKQMLLSKKPSAEKSSPQMVADHEMLRPKWWQIKKLVRPTYSFLFV